MGKTVSYHAEQDRQPFLDENVCKNRECSVTYFAFPSDCSIRQFQQLLTSLDYSWKWCMTVRRCKCYVSIGVRIFIFFDLNSYRYSSMRLFQHLNYFCFEALIIWHSYSVIWCSCMGHMAVVDWIPMFFFNFLRLTLNYRLQ